MIASARRRKASGILRPSAFAVVRLMTSSNAVGCSTRKISRLGTLENFVDNFARAPKLVRIVRSVRHKTSGLDISPYRTNCGQPRTQGKLIDANDVGVDERARTHIERLRLVPEPLERGANIPSTPNFEKLDLETRFTSDFTDLGHLHSRAGIAGICDDRYSA